MKTIIISLLVLSFTISSCSSSKKTTSSLPSFKGYPTSTPKATDDGLSYSTAIVITETSEGKGVHAEYDWIKKHYTKYTVKGQSLSFYENKPFDIITIVLSGDKELPLYFDISNYFGKF
jgi:major membrane immunogen (membrane-anchored lipoprotein)